MTVHRESSFSVVLDGDWVESCGLELKNIFVFQPGPMIDVVVFSGGDTNLDAMPQSGVASRDVTGVHFVSWLQE